jgi:broad specificity phosphatase PhoE
MQQNWPQILWVARHGQSAGNVARDAAEAAGLAWIDVEFRDIDTPLSDLGVQQSLALGQWFGKLPASARPQVVLCSPYVRARDTARLLMDRAGLRNGTRCACASTSACARRSSACWTA